MKKSFLQITAILLTGASVALLSGCGKDDTAPVITLIGDASVIVSLNGSYTDAGATANDDKDGSVTVSSTASSTNPDVNKAGVYTITYTASDAEGNTATATRTVTVRNDAYYLAGTFGTSEQPGGSVWAQTITVSDTENNKIKFSKFANYSGNSNITAKIISSGSDKYVVVNPATQTASGIGSDGCNHSFTNDGNGIKLQQVSGKWTFSIKFKDEVTGGGGSCTPTAALPYEDTFLQQ